ncbi:MAG: hypothetical protein WCK47_13550 [bacterium]
MEMIKLPYIRSKISRDQLLLFSKRHFRFLAVLLFSFLGLIIYAPALGVSYFIFGADTVSHDYIMHLYGWGQIAERGKIPLWCPYLFCGFPFIGSLALCPFYPAQLFYWILPHNTAFTLQYVFGTAAAGLFFAYWLRQIGVTRGVALWGGAVFMFSGHFITLCYAGHLQKMLAIAWAPLALAGVARLCRRGPEGTPLPWVDQLRAALIMSVAFAMQMLASHPQIFYATLITCALYAGGKTLPKLLPLVFGVFKSPHSNHPSDDTARASLMQLNAIRVSLLFVAALIAAVAFGAIQIFPALEMSRVSNRADGVTFEEATETSYPPVELLEYAIPRVFGDSVRGGSMPYFGAWGERIVSDYLGAPLLLLAAIGLFSRLTRIRFFLAIICLLSLHIGLGHYTPAYGLLHALLPGFNRFRSPGTFMFLADLSLVALATIGLQALINKVRESTEAFREESNAPPLPGTDVHGANAAPSPALKRTLRMTLSLSTVLIAAGCALTLAGIWNNWGVRTDIATAGEAQRHHINRGMILLGFQLAMAAGFLRAGFMRIAMRNEATRAAPLLLALFALVGLIASNRYFVRFEPLTPYMDYLRYQPVFATLENAPGRPARVLEEDQLKSYYMLHDLATPGGYHPVVLGRYEKLMQTAGYASPRMGSMFAIAYSRTNENRPLEGSWAMLRQTAGGTIWRWSGPARAYVKSRASIAEARDMREARLLLSGGQLALDTYVAEKAHLKDAACAAAAQSADGELASWEPGRITLRASSNGTALLPIAEVIAPGWKARTDEGVALPLIPVNLAQCAIALSGGRSIVHLAYQPFSFRLGGFVTLLFLSALAMSAGGWAARRFGRHQAGQKVTDALVRALARHGLT